MKSAIGDNPTILKMFVTIGLLGLVLSQCQAEPASEIKTTSDKLREFAYEVSGEIRIPTSEEVHQAIFLFDRTREYLAHPDDPVAAHLYEELISSPDAFSDQFEAAHANSLPLKLPNGQLDISKIHYWISRQIKFTKQESKLKHVSLTLRSINDVTLKPESDDRHLVLTYKARVLGVADFMDPGSVVSSNPMDVGFVFRVPRDPLQAYFETFEVVETLDGFEDFERLDAVGEPVDEPVDETVGQKRAVRFGEVYQDILAKVRKRGIGAALRDDRIRLLVEKTKSDVVSGSCSAHNQKHISPFNFFYFFNPALPTCVEQLDTAPLSVEQIEELAVPTTYPEFHRLFEDGKVDLHVFYNTVAGEETVAAGNFIHSLRRRGYETLSISEDNAHYVLSKDIHGIRMNVSVSVGSDGVEPFRGAIGSHEVVIYDGHAGYGANIDKNFTDESVLPNDRYQIFFLNGCATYKYGMTQILDAKALKDFDFYNQNVDVITAHDDVHGHLQNDVMVEKIEAAIPYFVNDDWSSEKTASFQSSFSWLAIVSRINEISSLGPKENGIFMVSGELDNDYRPGKTSYSGKPEPSETDLLQMVENPWVRERTRETALKGLLKMISTDESTKSIEDVQAKARDLCLPLRENFRSVIEREFFLPSCNLKRLDLSQPLLHQGRKVDPTATIAFHPSGQVEGIQYLEAHSIDGHEVAADEVTFHPNGALKRFLSATSFTNGGTGAKLAGGSLVSLFPSGRLAEASLEGPTDFEGVVYEGYIVLFENGGIEYGRGKTHRKFDGFELVGQGFFEFFKNGRLKSLNGDLKRSDARIEDLDALATIEFTPSGSLVSLASYADSVTEEAVGFVYEGQEFIRVKLREDGSVAAARYLDPVELDSPFPCATGWRDGNLVYWNRGGKVVGCSISEKMTINGIEVAAHTMVFQRSDGQLYSWLSHPNNYDEQLRLFQQEIGLLSN